MQPETEFVVAVRRWPVIVLSVLIPVIVVGYSAMVGLLLRGLAALDPVLVVTLAVVILGVFASVVGMVHATIQGFRMIRYPPRISPQGMRLWLFPTSEYVLLPWERITAVSTFVKGISRGMFVYVADPEGLARANASRVRKIRRAMRRFNGAPFVYGINAAPARLYEIDGAVRQFSSGRHMLHNR